jgi:hypothetical protein
MPDPTTAAAAKADAIEEPTPRTPLAVPSTEAAQGSSTKSTEILITEREVVFATAAAVALRRENIGRRFAAILRRTFVIPTDAARPRPRHYPKRYEYLERALMAREMDRL